MKPEQIYTDLIDLAEKLAVEVTEANLRKSGIKIKSGFCRVRNQGRFIMDKHLALQRKIEVLAEYISTRDLEDVYVVPALRDILDRYKPFDARKGERRAQGTPNASKTEQHASGKPKRT
jgi:hypothetical protein